MAIDPTRGLPSFSELYNAYKNKGNIGTGINAGVEGYFTSKAENAKQNLESAQAENQRAEAAFHKSMAGGGRMVNLAALPDEMKAKLAPYADANGNVPESTAKVAISTTGQGQDAEKAAAALAQKQAEFENNKKHQAEMTAVQQQLADLKAALGQSGQELNAAQTVANTTKGANPTLVEKLVGKAGKAINMPSIIPDEVTKADQNAAALNKLSGIAKMDHQIMPTPPADRGVQPATADMIAPPEPKRIFPMKGKGLGTEASPAPVQSQEDYDKLSPGMWFVDSTGKPTQKGKK